VALRAELDALPIQEDNPDLSYASAQPGRMHACGHDGHMTCLVGAVLVLSRIADQLPGKVKFIFQPAEEHGGGGGKLVEAGVLDNPRVAAAFALHGWPGVSLGQVVVGQGPVLAASTPFEVNLTGRGSHAAYPHLGNDVVLTSAHVVTALQAVSSRWNPVDPVVVSVCHISAGQAYNVLPEQCQMRGTIRALRQDSHDSVVARVRRIVEATAAAHGCTARIEFLPGYPALVNDPTCAKLVAGVAVDVLGTGAVFTDLPPGMGAEDFAFYSARVPTAWYRLGVSEPGGSGSPSLHSPRYNFPDQAIDLGVRLHCEIAHRFLSDPPMWCCG